MMMSTPFAFDVVESSMRMMVDGEEYVLVIHEPLLLQGPQAPPLLVVRVGPSFGRGCKIEGRT